MIVEPVWCFLLQNQPSKNSFHQQTEFVVHRDDHQLEPPSGMVSEEMLRADKSPASWDIFSSFLLKRQGHVTVTLQHYKTHLTLTAPPSRDWCLFLFSLSLQSQMFALKCLLKGFKGSSQNWRQLPMMNAIWCYTADWGLALPCLGSNANSDTRHLLCPK